jgi:vitamin B12 transporter
MRGSTYSQVLILINGMKMNDPLTSHFNGYIPVSIAEIERIEILRGAAASMYGADAVGGVINIVTKTFSNIKEGTHIRGNFNYGQHRLVSNSQGFTIRKGAATFGGGFSMNQSDGEYFAKRIIDTATALSAYNNNFDLKTVGFSFAYRFNSKINLKFHSSYDYRDFGARYFYSASIFDKSTERVKNWWNHAQLTRTTENSLTDFNVAYKYNLDEFVFSPDFASTNNHKTEFINITLNHLMLLDPKLTLKFGGQADQRKINSNDRGVHRDMHYGAYVMSVYHYQKLNVSLSARGDYDNNYLFEITPQFNASYTLPKLTLRASVGRSIRAADYTERYVSNNLKNLTSLRSLGNPNLEAERGWSEEMGFDFKIAKNHKIRSTVFGRQSSNLIDYVLTNQREIGVVSSIGSLLDSANYLFAKNISKASTYGFEIEYSVLVPFNKNFSINCDLGYTFLKTIRDEDIISVYIASHAKHLLTSQFKLNWKNFDLTLGGLFKERDTKVAKSIGSSLAKTYQVWNLKIGYNLVSNFGINIQIQNMFNEQYQNILGAQMPSRWFMAGIKYAL